MLGALQVPSLRARCLQTPLVFLLMPDRPHVGRDGLHIFIRQRHAAHRGHGAGMLLGYRHASRNGFREGLKAAVSPSHVPVVRSGPTGVPTPSAP